MHIGEPAENMDAKRLVRRDPDAKLTTSGCGAAWLARLLGVQEVPGSNPGGPTNTGNELLAFLRLERIPM